MEDPTENDFIEYYLGAVENQQFTRKKLADLDNLVEQVRQELVQRGITIPKGINGVSP